MSFTVKLSAEIQKSRHNVSWTKLHNFQGGKSVLTTSIPYIQLKCHVILNLTSSMLVLKISMHMYPVDQTYTLYLTNRLIVNRVELGCGE